LLGRSVSEDESVSIRTLASAAINPSSLTDDQRTAAMERLNRYFARVDAQRQPVSHEEEEATINEALRSTRRIIGRSVEGCSRHPGMEMLEAFLSLSRLLKPLSRP
jgi:hypothetical protein